MTSVTPLGVSEVSPEQRVDQVDFDGKRHRFGQLVTRVGGKLDHRLDGQLLPRNSRSQMKPVRPMTPPGSSVWPAAGHFSGWRRICRFPSPPAQRDRVGNRNFDAPHLQQPAAGDRTKTGCDRRHGTGVRAARELFVARRRRRCRPRGGRREGRERGERGCGEEKAGELLPFSAGIDGASAQHGRRSAGPSLALAE